METFSASLKEDEEHRHLSIMIDGEELEISFTGENSQLVKDVFNKLIIRLKSGLFEITMEETSTDLFSQVASEYVKQLNEDLEAVYKELEHFELLNEDEDEDEEEDEDEYEYEYEE